MRVRQMKICKEILLCFRRSSGFYGSQDVNPFSINNLQYQTNGKCIRHQRKFQLNVFSPSFQIRCNIRSKFWKMFVKSLLYLDTVIILVWKSLTFYRFRMNVLIIIINHFDFRIFDMVSRTRRKILMQVSCEIKSLQTCSHHRIYNFHEVRTII